MPAVRPTCRGQREGQRQRRRRRRRRRWAGRPAGTRGGCRRTAAAGLPRRLQTPSCCSKDLLQSPGLARPDPPDSRVAAPALLPPWGAHMVRLVAPGRREGDADDAAKVGALRGGVQGHDGIAAGRPRVVVAAPSIQEHRGGGGIGRRRCVGAARDQRPAGSAGSGGGARWMCISPVGHRAALLRWHSPGRYKQPLLNSREPDCLHCGFRASRQPPRRGRRHRRPPPAQPARAPQQPPASCGNPPRATQRLRLAATTTHGVQVWVRWSKRRVGGQDSTSQTCPL